MSGIPWFCAGIVVGCILGVIAVLDAVADGDQEKQDEVVAAWAEVRRTWRALWAA